MRGKGQTTLTRIYCEDLDEMVRQMACKNGYLRERGEKRWNSADAIHGLLSARADLRKRLAEQTRYHSVEIAGYKREIRELKEQLARNCKLLTV